MPHPFCSERQVVDRGSSASRSWARHRLSSFFHGESIVSSVRKTSHTRKNSSRSASSSQPQSEQHVLGLRSPTSTRSLIDPGASPISSTRSISPDTFEHLRRTSQHPVGAHCGLEREHTGNTRAERHLSRALSNPRRPRPLICARKKKRRWACFPTIDNPDIRTRAVGCVISGGTLVILLSIYLALAISGSIRGRAWNVVLIILILIATILSCHYLIRLFMLVLRARRQKERHQVSNHFDGDGFAQLREPIRVILARDEELGLHESNGEDSSQARVASPPPAYGLWRCSVRADPNLIHWRRTGGAEVQDETRELILAGNRVNRPPSYVLEDDLPYGINQGPRITVPIRAHF